MHGSVVRVDFRDTVWKSTIKRYHYIFLLKNQQFFREINVLIKVTRELISRIFCVFTLFSTFLHCVTIKYFFKLTLYLAISLVKMILSRKFCQKCARLTHSSFQTTVRDFHRSLLLNFCQKKLLISISRIKYV